MNEGSQVLNNRWMRQGGLNSYLLHKSNESSLLLPFASLILLITGILLHGTASELQIDLCLPKTKERIPDFVSLASFTTDVAPEPMVDNTEYLFIVWICYNLYIILSYIVNTR